MNLLDLISTLRSLRLSGEGGFQEAVQIITGHGNGYLHRRFLEGLGHACADREGGKIHVCAPRLVVLPRMAEDRCVAVLAGARSGDLLEELDYLAGNRSVKIESTSLGDGFPDRITLTGAANALKEVASNCYSLPVEIASDPTTPDAWRLLCSVPSLRAIIGGLTQETTGYSKGEPEPSAEVFNPATGYYDRWSTLREDYSFYYVLWKKEVYDYRLFWWQSDEEVEEGGRWIQRVSRLELDPFWMRWAVAGSAGADEALPAVSGDGTYKVPRRTPLPMELHRVCCLCSGFPPDEDDGGYIYRGVPPVIQQGVNERLRVEIP